jgi:hypothetical protein
MRAMSATQALVVGTKLSREKEGLLGADVMWELANTGHEGCLET